MNIDTYRDAFLKFLADGMDHEEACNQFDKDLLNQAVNAELERGDSVRVFNSDPMGCDNACGHETLFDLVVKAGFVRRNRLDFETQVTPLLLAGWTYEVPDSYRHNSKDFWRQPQQMSFYWRAPSKRPGKPGRRYLSTNQAFNAMQRANQPTP